MTTAAQPASAHHVPGLSFDAERLERRKKTLGASEVAAVAGLDPHRSALDIFLEKTGQVEPFQGNTFTEWGLRLEAVIAAKYAESQHVLLSPSDTVAHPTEPWATATPDRIVEPAVLADPWGLEIKNKSARQAAKWGESGTDQVPHEIAAQLHWSMLVTGFRRWDCAALFGGNEYRVYTVPFNAQIADDLFELAEGFWRNHVEKGIAPEIDGSKAAAEYLKRKFAAHSEEIREATREQEVWIQQLREIREKIAEAEGTERILENKLKDAIADAAGIAGRSGRVTWKAPAHGLPQWKAIAEALGAKERPDLVALHTSAPSRRFTASFPKE